MFEDVEYTDPAEVFRTAGHGLVHVGIEKGEIVKGKKEATPVTIDHAVSEVSVDDSLYHRRHPQLAVGRPEDHPFSSMGRQCEMDKRLSWIWCS
jgi:hypothetical protein